MPRLGTMRIAFDGTTLTTGRTGVGYYTEHLLQHLAEAVEASGDELVVISNQQVQTERPLPPHVVVHEHHRFPVRVAWMQGLAARVLDRVGADVVHFTNGMMPVSASTPTVVTVHDMSLRLYPWCHPVRRVIINRPLQLVAIHRADAIVAVSHSTRRDLLRLHGVPPDRVCVVHEAASAAFRPIRDRAALDAVRARLQLPERFVLYVGTVEPRKNLGRLVDAFAEARRRGIPHHLVCVGPYGWRSHGLCRRIEGLGLTAHVHFLGYQPFDLLPALYNLSEVFAFPSLYEGFGLPVVEAMACGTPVLTSETSSLAEIVADAAVTVDPLDSGALATAITRLAFDADLRAQLSAAGLARATAFSWSQAARDMLQVYRLAAGRAAPAEAEAHIKPPAAEVVSASQRVAQRGTVEVPDGP
jgi:glycosyltransferase involved in cell wall biosynthesis